MTTHGLRDQAVQLGTHRTYHQRTSPDSPDHNVVVFFEIDPCCCWWGQRGQPLLPPQQISKFDISKKQGDHKGQKTVREVRNNAVKNYKLRGAIPQAAEAREYYLEAGSGVALSGDDNIGTQMHDLRSSENKLLFLKKKRYVSLTNAESSCLVS